jgi:hypothetical protein
MFQNVLIQLLFTKHEKNSKNSRTRNFRQILGVALGTPVGLCVPKHGFDTCCTLIHVNQRG